MFNVELCGTGFWTNEISQWIELFGATFYKKKFSDRRNVLSLITCRGH